MFQTTITSLQESIRKHESRFAKILPVLVSVNQGLPYASVADIDQKHAKLSQVIEELQEKQWQSALTPSTQGFDSRSSAQLDANVRDIKAQLQTLQLRIVGNGVQIGGVLFQCFQDVKTWVVSRFQIKRYGLFGSPFWISSLLCLTLTQRNPCQPFIIRSSLYFFPCMRLELRHQPKIFSPWFLDVLTLRAWMTLNTYLHYRIPINGRCGDST